MKQKIIILTAILLFSKGISIQAQQTIASAGGNATGSGGTVSYTIGQQEYSSFSSGVGSANQGVQQPQEFFGTNCTPTTSTTNISICPTALPYSWNGLTFNAAGSQTKHLTNAAGCDSVATLNLTVVTTLPAIGGASNVCVGSNISLNNIVSGGVWSSVAGRASVNNSGVVTGTSAGTAVIKYQVAGCTSVTKNILVNALPPVPTIYYAPNTPSPQTISIAVVASLCKNRTFTLLANPTGGVWSSSGTSGFSINANTGLVNTGNTTGTVAVTYSYSNGCSNSRTINANVVACATRGVNSQVTISNEQLVIYPNPTHSFLNVKLDKVIGSETIIITDLYGKELIRNNNVNVITTIDVRQLSKGIYFVSLIKRNETITKKLIIE